MQSALDSLRAQQYENFRILISDNASTDRSREIAEQAASEDGRIRYERMDSNIGASANFRRVQELADGDYFMWAAGHDIWSPDLIAESVAILEANKSASIAFATSYWINDRDERDERDTDYPDTRRKSVFSRFFTVFWGNMHPVLGLIRNRCLKQTRGLQGFAGGDLVLLSELVLMGDFVHANNAWWNRRDVRKKEAHAERMKRYADPDYGLATSSLERRFPLLRLPVALVSSVWNARIGSVQKILIMLALIPMMPLRYLVGRHKANSA